MTKGHIDRSHRSLIFTTGRPPIHIKVELKSLTRKKFMFSNSSDCIDECLMTFRTLPQNKYAVELLDKNNIPAEKLLLRILKEISEIIPGLTDGYPFTAKQLCGAAFWDEFSIGGARSIGACLRHLVEYGCLPLKQIPTKKGAPLKYVLCLPPAAGKATQ